MEKRPLGQTDIEVSVICLGTMTWGEQNTQDEAFSQLDMALDHGVNFIDAAELYPVPPKGETYGETERILGHWLNARGSRDNLIIASKIAGPEPDFTYMRGGDLRFDDKSIQAALEGSLGRLKTDYIDLYQLHWPERKTNYFGRLGYEPRDDHDTTPIKVTLEALKRQVDAGKIRYVGLSNETPWGAMKFLELAREFALPVVASIQNPYSLLNRSYEIGLAEVSIREKAGLLAYSPLGFGVLSGKYIGNARPKDARLSLYTRFTRYTNPQAIAATERYVGLAQKHGLDPAQMALAFVNSRPFLTSNIIGATSLAQLKSNLDSALVSLSEEVLQGIEEIHREQPNPAP